MNPSVNKNSNSNTVEVEKLKYQFSNLYMYDYYSFEDEYEDDKDIKIDKKFSYTEDENFSKLNKYLDMRDELDEGFEDSIISGQDEFMEQEIKIREENFFLKEELKNVISDRKGNISLSDLTALNQLKNFNVFDFDFKDP